MRVAVRLFTHKGRGVVALEEFSPGEVIERCELILLPLSEVTETLERYVYDYRKGAAALALGHGSLFNHDSNANSEFWFDYRNKNLVVRAKRRIRSGEEITINYRYKPSLKKKLGIS